jgi:hypothetical protein
VLHLGKTQVVIWLLSNGACVDSEDEFGKMAEHYAAESGHVDLARALVRLRLGASLGGEGNVTTNKLSNCCSRCNGEGDATAFGELERLAMVKQHKKDKREAIQKIKARARQEIKALGKQNAKLKKENNYLRHKRGSDTSRHHKANPDPTSDWFERGDEASDKSTFSQPLPSPPHFQGDVTATDDGETQPSFYMYQADYLSESKKRHNKPAKPAPRAAEVEPIDSRRRGSTGSFSRLLSSSRSFSVNAPASPNGRSRRGSDPGPQMVQRRNSTLTRPRRYSTIGQRPGSAATRRESCVVM